MSKRSQGIMCGLKITVKWRMLLFSSCFLIFTHQSYSQNNSFLKEKLNTHSNSLQFQLKLDSVSSQLNNSLDGLGKMNLPRDKYYSKVDSLFAVTRAGLNGKKEFRFDSLNPESNELLKRYRTKLRTNHHRADSITQKLKVNPGLNLP